MNKTVKRTVTVIGCVLGVPVALFLLIYLVLAIIGCASYGEARALREYVCTIPETNSGFAPQGVTFCAERGSYILTGYGSDDTTLLYVVNGKDYERVPLRDENDGVLKGHAGGVTCTDKYVYITGDCVLLQFELDDIFSPPEGGAKVNRTIAVDNNASFCFNDGTNLYVGEFYREQNYKTSESHHYTTPNGAENKAIASCYNLADFELKAFASLQPYPLYCISIPDLVQGFAVHGDTIVMSRSYGLKNSALDFHADKKLSDKLVDVTFEKNVSALAAKALLYYVDDTTLDRTITLPAFSEDITIVDDRVVVTNESCANKYFVGKLFGANKVYSFPIETAD